MAGPKILIIDDEELLVKSTRIALELNGYTPEGALDAKEGISKAASFNPDLILLDIMMPGMDGWQALDKLKQKQATREIPVIIFTAKEYSDGKTLALSKGAIDYVAKPFRIDELISIIGECLPKGNTHG